MIYLSRFRAASIDNFEEALTSVHEQFDWPFPAVTTSVDDEQDPLTGRAIYIFYVVVRGVRGCGFGCVDWGERRRMLPLQLP